MRLRPTVKFANDLDEQLTRPDFDAALGPTMFSWTRTVRETIGLPASGLARRMEISQAAVTKLEQSEAKGAISIERLGAIARAMDCDLVYGFVPRSSFEKLAQTRQAQIEKARTAQRKIPPA